MEKWPDFFIVGAPRAGSTSLYEYLNSTKGICMSTIKEPFFFHEESESLKNLFSKPKQRIADKEKYFRLFNNALEDDVTGEASTTYLWDPQSSKLIHDEVPNAKIIILLRDPVERAFSHFLHNSRFNETRNFHDIIMPDIKKKNDREIGQNYCLDPGLYSIHLKRFWEMFGKNQVKVIIFEEFYKDAKSRLKEIFDFINVTSDVPESVGEIHNRFQIPRGQITQRLLNSEKIGTLIQKSVLKILSRKTSQKLRNSVLLRDVKKPKLSEVDRVQLEKFYLNDVKELEYILNRKLPWDWQRKYQ